MGIEFRTVCLYNKHFINHAISLIVHALQYLKPSKYHVIIPTHYNFNYSLCVRAHVCVLVGAHEDRKYLIPPGTEITGTVYTPMPGTENLDLLQEQSALLTTRPSL